MQYRSFGNKRFFVLLPFMFALTACGGGGSSSSSSSGAPKFDNEADKCLFEGKDRACGKVKDVQVVADANGNATVVWVNETPTFRSVRASRYTPGGGWSDPTRVSAYKAAVATELNNPEIATNSDGTVLAVFSLKTKTSDGVANQILAIPYKDGRWDFQKKRGEGIAYVISDENNDTAVANPDVAIEESGNGLAVWSKSDGDRQRIKASRFTINTPQSSDINSDSRWGTPAFVGKDEATGDATNPQVVIAPDGNVLVVWRVGNIVRAAQFSADSDDLTKAAITDIDDGANGTPSAPKIAVDGDGNAAAIWETGGVIMTSRYNPGTSPKWSSVENLTSDFGDDASEPSIASNTDGNMVAAWRVGDNEVVVSEFIGDAWSTAINVGSTSSVNSVGNPEIAIATNGNALAVWSQAEIKMDSPSIVASRYAAGKTKNAPEAIQSEDGSATLPKITIGGNGKGIAAWIQDDASNKGKQKVKTYHF